MKFYVYIYLNKTKPGNYNYGDLRFDFEPFYVGKGSNDRYKIYNHITNNNNSLSNKIKKIQPNNIDIIFLECFNEEESFELEKDLICLIGRKDIKTGPLCNLTGGGEGSLKGPETREKLRQCRLGKKLSEEHKKKIGDSVRGPLNGFFGRKHSEESLAKMKKSHKKYKPWNLGVKGYKNKPCSEERKQKVRESLKVYHLNKNIIKKQ